MEFKGKKQVRKLRKNQKQNIYCTEVIFFSKDNKMYYVLEMNWTKL